MLQPFHSFSIALLNLGQRLSILTAHSEAENYKGERIKKKIHITVAKAPRGRKLDLFDLQTQVKVKLGESLHQRQRAHIVLKKKLFGINWNFASRLLPFFFFYCMWRNGEVNNEKLCTTSAWSF